MTIKFSRGLCLTLLLLHLITAAVVWATTMRLEVRLSLLLLIFLSLLYFLARDVFLLLPDSWCEISLEQEGVAVVTRDGTKLSGQIAKTTTLSPYCIVLRIKQDGRLLPISRVIFPDALRAGAFRELCVGLQFA